MVDNAVVAWVDFHAADASLAAVARAQFEETGSQWHTVLWSREWKRMALEELCKPCLLSNLLPEELRELVVHFANR